MCIAVYKPMGVDFPVKRVLKRCFYKNPDGAGFMVATGSAVEIHKGFMGFRSFWKALREARAIYGDDKAYVMHFRISTQGGVRQDGCHPFPLSKDMEDLRRLDCEADIGIAHNGIIDLTSDWSSSYYSSYYYSRSYTARKQLDYSDTMKFITDYLSLIIHDTDYYRDPDTLELISKLVGSRLAILDYSGHCELIGNGWESSEDVWYSNGTYKEPLVTKAEPVVAKTETKAVNDSSQYNISDDYWASWYEERYGNGNFESYNYKDKYDYKEWEDPYSYYLNDEGLYDFSQSDCPATLDNDDSYCSDCKSLCQCWITYSNEEKTS